jgi:DNA invertase Pin-like site-specific DNA recombinase
MNAAIYARKATEQNVAEESKSVTRQIENAKAYAAKRGWTVADAHVYVDDKMSGAEFEKRKGLQRLLRTLPHPPFSMLIVSEQKSIGREMSETARSSLNRSGFVRSTNHYASSTCSGSVSSHDAKG